MNGHWTCPMEHLGPTYIGVLYFTPTGCHGPIGEEVSFAGCPDISPRLLELGVSMGGWLASGPELIHKFWRGEAVLVVVDYLPGEFAMVSPKKL